MKLTLSIEELEAFVERFELLEAVAEAARWLVDGPRDCTCWPECRMDGLLDALNALDAHEKGES